MQTPFSSPVASTSNGRSEKNLSVHFQNVSPVSTSKSPGSTTTAAQGVEGISANEDIFANSTASDYRFNRNRTMQWSRSGHSSNSGGHGDASTTTIYEESCPETSSFSIRQQQEVSTEKDSEDSAGSLARKFLGCFGVDMDGEHLQHSNGEIEIWRETSNEGHTETGIHQSDIVVEDSVEIDRPQTESERVRRFIMECLQNNPLRFRVVHDVFTIQNVHYRNSNISRICEQGGSCGRSIKGSIFLVTIHGNDNLHVVHDCAYNGNSCRSAVNADSPDLIQDLFGLQNAPVSTGTISQCIPRQANGKQYTLKSPAECGCGLNVVKLEIYPFAKISGLDKKNWWNHAETKMAVLSQILSLLNQYQYL